MSQARYVLLVAFAFAALCVARGDAAADPEPPADAPAPTTATEIEPTTDAPAPTTATEIEPTTAKPKPTAAKSEPPLGHPSSEPARIVIAAPGDTVRIYIDPDTTTALHFLSAIEADPHTPWPAMDYANHGSQVWLRPQFLPEQATYIGAFPVKTEQMTVAIELYAASVKNKADKVVRICPHDFRDLNAPNAEKLCDPTAETDKPRESPPEPLARPAPTPTLRTPGQLAFMADYTPTHTPADVIGGYERIPIAGAPSHRGVTIRAKYWGYSREYNATFLAFEVENHEEKRFDLAMLALKDQATGANHTADIWLGDHKVEGSPRAIIGPGARVECWMWVREAWQLGKWAELSMSEPDGQRRTEHGAIPVLDITPPASAQQQQREHEIALAKRTWIGAYGLGGVIWLNDGISMPAKRDATSIKGVGIRISKGLLAMSEGTTPLLSFEADAAIATSGTADFGDATVDGVQGTLLRTASLGRVHAGLALRWGNKTSVIARAGLSIQGVSEDSELITAGGPMPGPESSIDLTLGGYAGGGAEVRLGDSFMGGLALTFIDSGGRRTLEAGLTLAFALGP